MKKIITLSILCIIFAVSALSQRQKYVTSGAEIIFSQAAINDVNNPDEAQHYVLHHIKYSKPVTY